MSIEGARHKSRALRRSMPAVDGMMIIKRLQTPWHRLKSKCILEIHFQGSISLIQILSAKLHYPSQVDPVEFSFPHRRSLQTAHPAPYQ